MPTRYQCPVCEEPLRVQPMDVPPTKELMIILVPCAKCRRKRRRVDAKIKRASAVAGGEEIISPDFLNKPDADL